MGRRQRKLISCVAAALIALGLAGVGSAQAAVTIGSNLAHAADNNMPDCNFACTAANLSLPSDIAPGGLTSPVNGTVTSWKFSDTFAGNTVSLRVLRNTGTVNFTGIATSTAQTSVGGLNGPFQTSLPIKRGDYVGLDAGSGGGGFLYDAVAGTQISWWAGNGGPLANGETRAGAVSTGTEVVVQATVDPTNKVEFLAPVLNKKKGTATLPVHVPNPGTLGYGIMAGTVHGPSSTNAEGDVSLIVKATRRARRKLNQTGKVKETVLVTFTPTFGTALTVSHTFKLRKNLKR